MFIEVAAHARWINALDVARNGLVRFLMALVVYSHWLCAVPRQGPGLEPEQWGTICVGRCPCSGAV